MSEVPLFRHALTKMSEYIESETSITTCEDLETPFGGGVGS